MLMSTQNWYELIRRLHTERRAARTDDNDNRVENHLKERLIESGVDFIRALLTEQWISDVIDCENISAWRCAYFEQVTRIFELFGLTLGVFKNTN